MVNMGGFLGSLYDFLGLGDEARRTRVMFSDETTIVVTLPIKLLEFYCLCC